MNEEKNPTNHLVTLVGTAINTLISHPIILYPFCVLAFMQLLALEILYFSPREPLNGFFAPIVRRLWSEAFLHYPMDLILLPKLYYYAQVLIFIFLGGFFVGIAIRMIAIINSERKVTFQLAFKETLPAYVHIFLTSVLSFFLFFGFTKLYGLLIQRATQIRSEQGVYFWIKKTVFLAEPYAYFIGGVLITTILAFMIPIIVLDNKKFFNALALNFKNLWKSFWFVFMVVFLPTLLYVPVLLLRSNIAYVMDATVPGVQGWSIVLSVLVTLIIDAVVYTSITTVYLFKKES